MYVNKNKLQIIFIVLGNICQHFKIKKKEANQNQINYKLNDLSLHKFQLLLFQFM
jgi:hypothetical protein